MDEQPTIPIEQPEEPQPEPPRRLHRSADNKMLLGVCGGLADYFDADATLIRVGFVLLSLLGGSGIALYIVLALIMPSQAMLEVHPREAARSTIDEARDELERAADRVGEWVNGLFGRK